MPSKVSDIHEISVLIGIKGACKSSFSFEKKNEVFQSFSKAYGKGKINVSTSDLKRNQALFDRALSLGELIKTKFKLRGEKIDWKGLEKHKVDSSDILADEIGISLKDSSKIIRNSGFTQVLKTFCEKPIKEFKDPFWEFSPKLSVKYLHTVIEDCFLRRFFQIREGIIFIGRRKRKAYSGNLEKMMSMELKELVNLLSKSEIKELVKDFSSNGNTKALYEIRKNLVNEVAENVISVLKEGLIQNPKYFSENIKYMLQYREKKKIFGFSSRKYFYAGIIKSKHDILVKGTNVFHEMSNLTERTTGLQINICTRIEIVFSDSKKETLQLQNQLRYKHRTFSCAPEANFHLLDYKDWEKIYPDC